MPRQTVELSDIVRLHGEADEELVFSAALTMRGSYYFAERATGMYLGLGVERLYTRVEDTEVDREAYLASVWVPHIHGGYRFSFDRFHISPGAALGLALVSHTETEDLSKGTNLLVHSVKAPDNTPFATIDLEVGVSF